MHFKMAPNRTQGQASRLSHSPDRIKTNATCTVQGFDFQQTVRTLNPEFIRARHPNNFSQIINNLDDLRNINTQY
jgi:hypothetical protein